MTGLSKWIFLFTVGSIQAQDPRKRVFNQLISPIEEMRLRDEGMIACSDHHCFVKRSPAGQDEMGPFWANRGKKDPSYQQETLYAEEPYWVLVRRDDHFQEEPFFISRGKKEAGPSFKLKLRDRRELPQDVDSPFFAARGKKAD